MTRPDTRPADGVDVVTALACLNEAGIPEKVLTSAGIDIADPAALRAEVERLLIAAVSEDSIVNERQVLALQDAYGALYTTTERAHLDELSRLINSHLALVADRPVVSAEMTRERELPWYGSDCLGAD